MSDETCTIMIAYLRNNVIENFSINHLNKTDAEFYCETINNLKIDDELKVCAKIINDNTYYSVNDILPLSFDTIVSLSDREVRKMMMEVDSQLLAKALKGASKDIQDKIFNNISTRAADMLKEDMEFIGPVRKADIKEAQKNILKTLRKLDELGEITIDRGDLII